VLLFSARSARAGGIEYPDNGVEGMGRGAAFTAKADDGTAMIYNVAGLARQRGLRLTSGVQVALHSATFQRAGTYPDNPSDPLTPWGGQKYPLVKSTGLPLPIPNLILSTDLGSDRLTVAGGFYAPSVITSRLFPLGIDGKPSPSRYEAAKGGGIIVYPSAGFGYRVTQWLDVGAAINVGIASLEATTVASVDLAKAVCPNQEYQPCDSRQTVKTTGATVAGTFGAMLRPTRWFALGAQFRTPHTFKTEGTVTAKAPSVQPSEIPPAKAYVTQAFPWVLRGGARVIGMKDKFEQWDAEFDVTYEAWASALGDGTQVYVPKLSVFEDIRISLKLGFHDTMSYRGGGAFNFPVGKGIVTLRAGGFYDTSATKPEYTRLLFDSLAKTGITAGLGYKQGSVQLNVALANIFEETRNVTNGQVRPINGAQNGRSVDSTGALYAPVNNGLYTANTFVIAAGMTVQLEELLKGKKRIPTYGADYEVTTESASEEPKPESAAPSPEPDPDAQYWSNTPATTDTQQQTPSSPSAGDAQRSSTTPAASATPEGEEPIVPPAASGDPPPEKKPVQKPRKKKRKRNVPR
jgi:long-chain fatty acid transport protein